MDVVVPFYMFKKEIEKESKNDSLDFKYLLVKQIETFKEMVKDYIIKKCEKFTIIDLERDNFSVDEAKEKFDIILNPSYKVKVNPRYEIKIKSDMLIKTNLLKHVFCNFDENVLENDFIHINIVYKSLNINKKGEVCSLSKFEKLNQTLLSVSTGCDNLIYICRKYKMKDVIIDHCFGLCGISKISDKQDNMNYLNNLFNKNQNGLDMNQNDKYLDEINPLLYKRKFKLELKKEYNLSNLEIGNMINKTIFLDFEFIPDIIGNFETFPKTSRKSIIFMVGIGYIENGEWVYKDYTVKELTESDERIIINNWIKDMKTLNQNGYTYIMHWSKAEKTCMSKDILLNLEKSFQFVDLMYTFKNCQTQEKKFKSLSLKNVSKIFNEFHLINLKWDEQMSSGKSAMTETLFCNLILQNKKRKREKKLIDFDAVKNVMKYNEIDVKMMFLILEKMTK